MPRKSLETQLSELICVMSIQNCLKVRKKADKLVDRARGLPKLRMMRMMESVAMVIQLRKEWIKAGRPDLRSWDGAKG